MSPEYTISINQGQGTNQVRKVQKSINPWTENKSWAEKKERQPNTPPQSRRVLKKKIDYPLIQHLKGRFVTSTQEILFIYYEKLIEHLYSHCLWYMLHVYI